jgi:hypothetical protein
MTMVQQASKQIAERNGCKCKKIPNSTYMEIHIVHQSINRNNCHSYQEISKTIPFK